MREIKFRAWCKTYNGYDMLNSFCYLDKKDNHFFAEDLTNDRFDVVEVLAVMQYTGLKDKNGVEIYEGDIIKLCENKNGSFQVEFRNAYVGGWVLTRHSTKDWISLGARKDYDIEVIGNIYENPELLED